MIGKTTNAAAPQGRAASPLRIFEQERDTLPHCLAGVRMGLRKEAFALSRSAPLDLCCIRHIIRQAQQALVGRVPMSFGSRWFRRTGVLSRHVTSKRKPSLGHLTAWIPGASIALLLQHTVCLFLQYGKQSAKFVQLLRSQCIHQSFLFAYVYLIDCGMNCRTFARDH